MEDDDSPVTPGVTVEAEVVDAEGNSETTLPVSYSGDHGSKGGI